VRNIITLLASILVLLLACQNEPGTNVTDQRFFDLSNYFKAEQKRLSKLTSPFTKKAVVNGNEEIKVFESLDFEKELAMFVDSDINRIAWFDKYQVDSSFVNGQLHSIEYITTDQSLKTQGLTIQLKNNQVSRVDILRKSTSIAANIKQELTYQPNIGYSIISTQNTRLSDPEVIELEVRF
jgi:hypothetical protein